MTTSTKPATPYLHVTPLPDVAHTRAPQLPPPERAEPGRCFCCGLTVLHRFTLSESLPLKQLSEAAEDALNRLSRAQELMDRLCSQSSPEKKALKSAQNSLLHASLAARRLALRHVPSTEITETTALTQAEIAELEALSRPFELCYFCHAWHTLNGYAAAQGTMVWLPDLHPRSIVALNRHALKACFSSSKNVAREGKKVLAELLRHRLPVEERFGTWRPADFADALRRYAPSKRQELREKMTGIALILTPDSLSDKENLN
ncbi:TPA: conjugal transfer protein TraT [Kluyvera ascorbata]|nr:conjugal transfer protein TraT [Kluyvera ascorbata]